MRQDRSCRANAIRIIRGDLVLLSTLYERLLCKYNEVIQMTSPRVI